MTDTGNLHIPEFAHGYLLALSHEIFLDVSSTQYQSASPISEVDEWKSVRDVPFGAGEHAEYTDYDLHFWYDIENEDWHCDVYHIEYDSVKETEFTNTGEHRRLW